MSRNGLRCELPFDRIRPLLHAVLHCLLSLCWSIRLQNVLLLAASYGLVASFSLQSLYILLGYSVLVYLLGLLAARYPGRWFSRALLLGLVLGCFYLFKYQAFFVEGVQAALAQSGWRVSLPVLEVLVPIGMSFYIFHSVSYLVSINRCELAPAAPLNLALYLAFFPSLVAGPVNRALDMLPQICPTAIRQVLEPQRALGLIALAVVKVFTRWLAGQRMGGSGVRHAWQLHARAGVAECVWLQLPDLFQLQRLHQPGDRHRPAAGFRLPENFNAPYAAHNLKAFWGRWHISLSRFIRDYVYIPWAAIARACGAAT